MVGLYELTALLDANVLYPAPLRDLLLNLADVGLFKPKWSAQIQEEWIRNLLEQRPDLNKKNLKRTQRLMDLAFPDANVKGYEHLIDKLKLPDPDDRHVLATGIESDAHVIVSANSKDFPKAYLKTFGIVLQGPDEFVLKLIKQDELKALQAFDNQVKSLKNPPQTKDEVRNTLHKCGLVMSISLLK
jgi:predicted nucleic acid-binding protein